MTPTDFDKREAELEVRRREVERVQRSVVKVFIVGFLLGGLCATALRLSLMASLGVCWPF